MEYILKFSESFPCHVNNIRASLLKSNGKKLSCLGMSGVRYPSLWLKQTFSVINKTHLT